MANSAEVISVCFVVAAEETVAGRGWGVGWGDCNKLMSGGGEKRVEKRMKPLQLFTAAVLRLSLNEAGLSPNTSQGTEV